MTPWDWGMFGGGLAALGSGLWALDRWPTSHLAVAGASLALGFGVVMILAFVAAPDRR